MPNDLEAERKALAKQRREIEREREALEARRRDLDETRTRRRRKSAAVMMMMNQGKDIEVKRPRYRPWRPARRLSYRDQVKARTSAGSTAFRSHHRSKNSAATSRPII